MHDIRKLEKEENVREAASVGDMEVLTRLLELNDVEINSQNKVNGWTALHWAVKRGHENVVKYLLSHGADPSIKAVDGTLPQYLTTDADMHSILGGSQLVPHTKSTLPILPNYLANLTIPFCGKSRNVYSYHTTSIFPNNGEAAQKHSDLVLKIRVALREDKDFIEVEMPKDRLKYDDLLSMMCAELGIQKQDVQRVRKLPNTIIRKDKDVTRLTDFQELELIVTCGF